MLLSLFNELKNVGLVLILFIIFISSSQAQVQSLVQEDESNKKNEPIWDIHFQQTLVDQYHPSFKAKYSGKNSLITTEENCLSLTTTLFLRVKLWQGAEFNYNPEVSGGTGFSKVLGIAGFTNNEIVRVGNVAPTFYSARYFLEQKFILENSKQEISNAQSEKEISSLIFRLGKFSSLDYFDNNKYSHDGRSQFMNWALVSNGAWDYAADTRGYTIGFMAEFNNPVITGRLMLAVVSTKPNGSVFDRNISSNNSLTLELEKSYRLIGENGIVRFLIFRNSENSGYYSDAIKFEQPNFDSIGIRKNGTTKFGFGINFEQDLNDNMGMFLRASWNDGKTETWMFTEIDHSISAGVQINGNKWKRNNDNLGLGFCINGISSEHKEFLRKGGYGFIIGDGYLNYGLESHLEAYYKLYLTEFLQMSVFYQFVNNPAYNRDRGPVNVFSLRTHIEF